MCVRVHEKVASDNEVSVYAEVWFICWVYIQRRSNFEVTADDGVTRVQPSKSCVNITSCEDAVSNINVAFLSKLESFSDEVLMHLNLTFHGRLDICVKCLLHSHGRALFHQQLPETDRSLEIRRLMQSCAGCGELSCRGHIQVVVSSHCDEVSLTTHYHARMQLGIVRGNNFRPFFHHRPPVRIQGSNADTPIPANRRGRAARCCASSLWCVRGGCRRLAVSGIANGTAAPWPQFSGSLSTCATPRPNVRPLPEKCVPFGARFAAVPQQHSSVHCSADIGHCRVVSPTRCRGLCRRRWQLLFCSHAACMRCPTSLRAECSQQPPRVLEQSRFPQTCPHPHSVRQSVLAREADPAVDEGLPSGRALVSG